jgi:hypothetical protein
MSGKRREPKGKLLAVRIPDRLLAELDEHLAAMQAEAPWVHMTRSDAVRWLLEAAIRSERRSGR